MNVKNLFGCFILSLVVYIFDILRIGNISPELLVVFTLASTHIYCNYSLSVIVSLLSSVFMCAFGGRNLMISLLLTQLVSASAAVFSIAEKRSFCYISAIITFILYDISYYLILYFDTVCFESVFMYVVLPSAAYNTLLYFLLYHGISKGICRQNQFFRVL